MNLTKQVVIEKKTGFMYEYFNGDCFRKRYLKGRSTGQFKRVTYDEIPFDVRVKFRLGYQYVFIDNVGDVTV